MTQALYRKWRPQTFDQVVGQEHVTQTLRNALALGRVGHAYLFAGLRGTGKTTMARLLAKAVNCLAEDPAHRPCNACVVCKTVNEGRLLDLIEIDAASHTGVDDVRELRDKVGFRPNECRYKVYIIDEVHRFSGSAFDALLKTIEEPPEHAIFILATTEIHKVPATILSRCQRFDFRRIPLQQIIQRLQSLAQAEGIRAEPEAMTLIARSATGSLRDAESLLDQLAATGGASVTLQQVQSTLGTVDAELVAGLVDSLVIGNVSAGLTLINQALDQGVDLRQFVRQIVDHLRGMLLIQLQGAALLDLSADSLQVLKMQAEQISTPSLIRAIKCFNQAETELRGGWQPQLPLELALVEVITGQDDGAIRSSAAPAQSVAVREVKTVYRPEPKSVPLEPESLAPVQKEPESLPQEQEVASDALTWQVVQQHWPQILAGIKARDQSIQALLNSTRPSGVREGTITLQVAHEFARAKLSRGRAKRLVVEVINQVLGRDCQIEYQVATSFDEASFNNASLSESSLGQAPLSDTSRAKSGDEWADDPLVQAARKMGAKVKPISEGREA